MLRPARRPTGAEARFEAVPRTLRRLVREIRSHWPRVEILIRADSHFCAPEVLDFCRAARIDFVLGVAPTTTLRQHVAALEASTAARHVASPAEGKRRRNKTFFGGARSWSRVERIIARVEAGRQGIDTRFVATSLAGGDPRAVYEAIYRARGQAGNHIRAAFQDRTQSRTPAQPCREQCVSCRMPVRPPVNDPG